MSNKFDFNNLFTLDMANNHQGQMDHAHRIISEMAQIVHANGVRAALKFQFRHLDTFIHPAHVAQSSNKHVHRFLSTRLSKEQFAELTQGVRDNGLITMSTPFDEASVDIISDLDIEIIKVASCSADDWPLLEKIADANKPVIFSTGGLDWKQIDALVSFFDHRRVHFAIMHCVSIYPTPDEQLQLNQLDMMRQRYPEQIIGFSTHENPSDVTPAYVAVAKGAQILERHVGVETDEIKLNKYSSTPEQLDQWIKAALKARVMCGADERPPSPREEIEALQKLKRGVFARRELKAGARLERDDVYFAIPYSENQLSSGEWKDTIVLDTDVAPDEALYLSTLTLPNEPDKQAIFNAIHLAKAMLNESRIALPTEFETEFSHHYGLACFHEVGIIMVTVINRSYCKKLIIQLPGQRHPMHYHKRKEETFQVMHGVLEVQIEGRRRTLYPGDTQLVQQGVWHEFWTETGVIFEEISTTHYKNDSFYEDKSINQNTARKTIVNQWGRYQI